MNPSACDVAPVCYDVADPDPAPPPYPKEAKMCSSCGYPAAPGHWTEAGADTPHDRLRARFRRAQILQSVLPGFGLTAHDGALVPGIQLSTLSGNQTIVPDLEQIWIAAEQMTGRAFDPLDPRFLARDPSGATDGA